MTQNFQIIHDGLAVAFPRWLGIPGLTHGVTTRAALPQPGKDDFFVTLARARKVGALPRALSIGADQVHGIHIEVIGGTPQPADTGPPAFRTDPLLMAFEFAQTDGLIATDHGVLLVVQTADCLPVFVVDWARRIVGLAHCGRQGLREGLAEKIARSVATVAGARTTDAGTPDAGRARTLEAWLGPCIRAERYEVGRELVEDFRAAFPDVEVSHDGVHLDLAAVARRQLTRAGLPPQNIFDCGQCTLARPDLYHSYRGEGENAGRLLSYIGFDL